MATHAHPFKPLDAHTVDLSVSNSTSRAALVLTSDVLERGPISLRLSLIGTDNARLAFGGSTVDAELSDILLQVGMTEVMIMPGNKDDITHVAAIADGGTGCTLSITTGIGY